MKHDIKLKGQLRFYMQWPAFMIIFLILMDIWIFMTENPATAAKGINLLVEQGILYKRRGIGMFVAPGAGQAVRASRQAAFYKRFVCPMVKEAAGLGLTVQQLNEMVARAAEEGKQ